MKNIVIIARNEKAALFMADTVTGNANRSIRPVGDNTPVEATIYLVNSMLEKFQGMTQEQLRRLGRVNLYTLDSVAIMTYTISKCLKLTGDNQEEAKALFASHFENGLPITQVALDLLFNIVAIRGAVRITKASVISRNNEQLYSLVKDAWAACPQAKLNYKETDILFGMTDAVEEAPVEVDPFSIAI